MLLTKTNEPLIVKTTDYQKCLLFLCFPIDKINDLEKKVLRNVMLEKSVKYDSEKKVYEARINNYCISFKSRIFSICNSNFLEILLFYPSEKCINKNVLYENLLFLKEMIYNPLLPNGTMDADKINNFKTIIKKNVYSLYRDSMWYYDYHNLLFVDENDFFKDEFIDNPNNIDKITPEEITSLYKKIIKNKPMTFFIGDADPEETRKMIMDVLFDNKIEEVKFDAKYTAYFNEIPDKILEKVDQTNYKSSSVFYNYKVKGVKTKKDEYLLSIVKKLISSSSSTILFDKLRTEANLIYKCGASICTNNLLLTVWAYTGKNNINKVKEGISSVIALIKKEEFINKILPKIKEEACINMMLEREDLYNILMIEIDKYIESYNNSFYEEIKDVTASDIIEFMENKLTLVSIYTGVGEINE